MSIMKSVKENEKLILSFIGKITNEHKNYYAIMSALNSLDNNNEVQEYFVMTLNEEFTQGELILRLYGLLQGLFVSIDSLYALAYALTNSKSFININQNPELRQLKYIRNDVVGHPSNRVYSNTEIGYCILPKESIKASEFNYYIYSKNELKTKDVNIISILDNYYIEANKLLNDIFDTYEKLNKTSELSKLANNIYDLFNNKQKYLTEVKKLKKSYMQLYSGSNRNQHRLLWRISLLEKLVVLKVNDDNEKELYNYCIMFEIIKINELANRIENIDVVVLNNKLPLPKYLKGFYKMLNNNPELVDAIDYLHDMSHPLFKASLEKCFTISCQKSLKDANNYLSLISRYMIENNSDMVYAIGILVKQYKQK